MLIGIRRAQDPEEAKQVGGTRQQELAREGRGSAEDAYMRTLRLGWKKEGDLSVAQVDININTGALTLSLHPQMSLH